MRVYDERFTFGKYDDVPLKEIPDSYLRWYCAEFEHFYNQDEDLLKAVQAEQARRKENQRKMDELDKLSRQTPEGRARLTSAALQDFFSNAPARQSRQFRPKR